MKTKWNIIQKLIYHHSKLHSKLVRKTFILALFKHQYSEDILSPHCVYAGVKLFKWLITEALHNILIIIKTEG